MTDEVDIQQIQKEINALTEKAKTTLNATLTNTYNLPKKEQANTQKITVSDYIQQYVVTLANEESASFSVNAQFQRKVKDSIDQLCTIPNNIVASNIAINTINEIKDKQNEINTLAKDAENRLNMRYESANKINIEEGLPTLKDKKFKVSYDPPRNLNAKQTQQTQPQKSVALTTPTKKNILSQGAITLPIFYGQMENWGAFYSTFKKLVADDPDIDNSMKHNILRQHLREEPFEMIRPYSTDGSEFETAFGSKKQSKNMQILRKNKPRLN
ncbi:hypothetical protein CAEBREN_29083 [Caenorhabditis brenneri]|uniref:Uncharacterized protein n=1 Tax=Caenorhabditis brenneri TaxID=135651 RepID=G0N299_CAEBE|nr:hypothetical protein CAEBREN_29083 [Caenorhabditis brenneri]